MGGPAAEQRSDAAHFSTLCCQMPPSHTHTYIQLRCLQNRLQPQCNPKNKQRCQRHWLQPRPRRSALLSLSSTLILSLPHSLALFSFVHCISWGALSWLLLLPGCDCSCSLLFSGALSHSLSLSSFLPHPKGFLFSFPLTVLLLCLDCCCCFLCCTVSAALLLSLPSTSFIRLFGCFRLLLLPAVQGVSLFCFVLALFGYFWIATLRGVRTSVSDEWLWVKGGAGYGLTGIELLPIVPSYVSFAWKASVNYPETILSNLWMEIAGLSFVTYVQEALPGCS